jgi:hypothetical protein
MKRVIFSLFIDIPKEELDIFDKHIKKEGAIPTNYNTKNEFQKNYKQLVENKVNYAKSIGIDFVMVENDTKCGSLNTSYINYYKWMREFYPEITSYNIVNFFKIHLLYEFSKEYDEVLYLDFDVVTNTTENFFEVWDLSKGVCVLNNNERVSPIQKITDKTQTIRSPNAKFYNAQAMLIEKGLSPENDVINTGIVGISKKHLDQLEYFKDFKETIQLMKSLIGETDIFPKKIADFFGYDNETIFAVKLKEHKVPVQWLDQKWHYFFDTQMFIPSTANFIHAINKRFDIVWRNINA